jgi:osmotically-inducible protein OsmY
MLDSPTWKQALEQADHRIAIGLTQVYLGDKFDGLDWSKCVSMETGGSHRLNIATSVVFTFRDKGIEGRWHFDIESREANGSGHYQIDVEGIQRLLAVLPPYPRRQFKDYLDSCVTAIEKNAAQYQEIATKEYGTAGVLRSVAREDTNA